MNVRPSSGQGSRPTGYQHSPPLPQGAPAADRRSAIRQAALRLFASQGYRSTTMTDIGAAVGIRGPSLCKHVARIASYSILDMGIGVASWFHEGGEFGVDQLAYQYGDIALRIAGARRPGPVPEGDADSA